MDGRGEILAFSLAEEFEQVFHKADCHHNSRPNHPDQEDEGQQLHHEIDNRMIHRPDSTTARAAKPQLYAHFVQ